MNPIVLSSPCIHCGKRLCRCQRTLFDATEWAGGVFGGRIEIGWDIRIEIFPNQPWTSAKLFFFDGLAAIVGADLSDFEAGLALSRLVEGINNDPEHDEGGWIAVHSRGAR